VLRPRWPSDPAAGVGNADAAKSGGLTQFLQFRCVDVLSEQIDRVALHFSDDEGEAIGFDCADCQVVS